jgi:hypothetical protein
LLPVTGASTSSQPMRVADSASSLMRPTVTVLHSTSRVPGRTPARAPVPPSHTSCDAASSATMLNTMSASATCLARRCGHGCAPRRERCCTLRTAIVDGEARTGVQQPASHPRAHDARPRKAMRVFVMSELMFLVWSTKPAALG